MVGLLRSAPSELPHLTTQFLDFEDDSELTARSLTTAVLQFAGASWLKKEGNYADMLHTTEPELIFQKGGRVMIPLMKAEEAMNKRYNASRRAITSKVPATRACIGEGPMKRGYYVREDRTLESAREAEGPEVRVSHSFLKSIRFSRDVSLFLSIGKPDSSTADANIILPEEVDNIDPDIAHRYIIDWGTEAEVEALVEPADTFPLFSKETAYWLVGLTGTLGLSLCQWMLHNGARYIVLTSRNPKIEPDWLKTMASQQAIIKVTSCDITIMQDLQKTYEDICSTMPPIRGVFQGSMVLNDIGLPSMGLEHLQTVLRPKVEGSINLDKLFQDNSLDFFIFFSSVTSLVGTLYNYYKPSLFILFGNKRSLT
ncbi:unnamed protein product [Clonostachys byssicola]|uniref:Ketoreductase domain-containing protein n=1 Tax=Clonostachys byssicola TaxID=160290 RepID=A0A9N9US81_9HYPO|nr:unnamed protein product [Clonostachys byssicola]